MTASAEVVPRSMEAVTLTARLQSTRGIDAGLDDGDLAEGHLAAVRGANAHVLEVAEGGALVARLGGP